MGSSRREPRSIQRANRTRRADFRHQFQDWLVWLAEPDKRGRTVQLKLRDLRLADAGDGKSGGAEAIYEALQAKFEHPIERASQFYLQYKLPHEAFVINVELSNRQEVQASFLKFAALPKAAYLDFGPTLVLNCRSKQWTHPPPPPAPPRAHLGARAPLTRFLAGMYMSGNLSASQMGELMEVGLCRLRRAAHALLPPEEAAFHSYLLEKGESERAHVDPDQLLKKGKITMQEYESLKFPELMARRAARLVQYPLPEVPATCVVCKRPAATVRCMECTSRACGECLRACCPRGGPSYLFFHQAFCLKFGVPVRAEPPRLAKQEVVNLL